MASRPARIRGGLRRVLLCGLSGLLLAGPPSERTPPLAAQQASIQDRAEMVRRVTRAFRNRVRQELRLTPTEMQELAEVLDWSEGERRDIQARNQELTASVREFLRDGGTEERAQELLDARVALQARESELFTAEQERLLSVLSPAQAVRFNALRDQLNARIRQLRSGQRGGPGPGRWPEPGRLPEGL